MCTELWLEKRIILQINISLLRIEISYRILIVAWGIGQSPSLTPKYILFRKIKSMVCESMPTLTEAHMVLTSDYANTPTLFNCTYNLQGYIQLQNPNSTKRHKEVLC